MQTLVHSDAKSVSVPTEQANRPVVAEDTVSFDVIEADAKVIRKIATRARALETAHGGRARTAMDWWMDITAAHANGNPLRLAELLKTDDFNFMHDVFGICRHLDRRSGQLTGFFSPRFSQPERAAQ